MPELQVKINNRIASYEGQGIVAENEDYVLSFVFDEDWSSLPLYARFVWNKYYWDEEIKDGKAAIPYVKNGTQLLVGVIAGDEISTTATEIPVFTSIIREGTIGHPRRPADPNATKGYVDEKVAELKVYTDDEIAALETQISEQTATLEKYVLEQIKNIPVDEIPTEGSLRLISSGGVYSWVPQVAEEFASQYVENLVANADVLPTEGSSNLVQSGGVWNSIGEALGYATGMIYGLRLEFDSEANVLALYTSEQEQPLAIIKIPLDGKLNKSTESGTKAYIIEGGKQKMQPIAFAQASSWSIAERGDKGILVVGTPTKSEHATTKQYVDDALAALKITIEEEILGGSW